MKISICIPMYNEITNVAATATQLVSEMDAYCEKSGDSYEILFSDDGSQDGTYDAIPTGETLGALHGEIIPLYSATNHGKGATVRRAMLKCSGDVALYTDCDLAYGSAVIPQAIELMKSRKTDMLVGSRAIHPNGYDGYTFLRKFASKVYIKLLSLITGLKITDSQCGFKVFRGELARSIFAIAETDGWAFDLELFLLAKREGADISEMPISIINHNESRISVVKDSVKMLREIFRIKNRVKALGPK